MAWCKWCGKSCGVGGTSGMRKLGMELGSTGKYSMSSKNPVLRAQGIWRGARCVKSLIRTGATPGADPCPQRGLG